MIKSIFTLPLRLSRFAWFMIKLKTVGHVMHMQAFSRKTGELIHERKVRVKSIKDMRLVNQMFFVETQRRQEKRNNEIA